MTTLRCTHCGAVRDPDNDIDMAECSEADRLDAVEALHEMAQELEAVQQELANVKAERDAALADKQMYLTMFAEAKGQRTL
jgi:hypothetical protein